MWNQEKRFLIQFIQILLDFIKGRINIGACILAMENNTVSIGWTQKSNFREKDKKNFRLVYQATNSKGTS